jgi:uncharacterized protein YjiS (DUF1127 family)
MDQRSGSDCPQHPPKEGPSTMASAIENAVNSIFDWVGAADHRYREACRMLELDDHLLGDIGVTREELLGERRIERLHGTSPHPLGRRRNQLLEQLRERADGSRRFVVRVTRRPCPGRRTL